MKLVITNTTKGVITAILLALVAAIAHPLFGIVTLVFVLTIHAVINDKSNITHPAYVISILIGFYFVVGGLNISTYRGEIEEKIQYFQFILMIIFVLGCIILDFRKCIRNNSNFIVPTKVIIFSALPGLAGLIWMGISTGFPLIMPDRFTSVPPKSFFLSEMSFVTFILMLNNLNVKQTISSVEIFLSYLYIFLSLSLPGYRGWPIIALLCTLLLSIKRSPAKIIKYAGLYGTIIVFIMSGLAYYRRLHNIEFMQADILLEKVHAEHLGTFIGLLHVALRESIALSQSLIEDYMAGRNLSGTSLFLSDFLTLLPGKQDSGGIIIASLFGELSGVGLTAGALGALVYEFGFLFAYFVIFTLGIVLAYFYRLAKIKESPGYFVLYCLIVIYSVHYIHRGIPKPSYLIIPIISLVALIFSEKYNSSN